MSSEGPADLSAKFIAGYVFPFAGYSWKSQRARSHWIDLEVLQDALAGPVSKVVNDGNCAYVYARNDEYFAGVDDPTTLRTRLQGWHSELIAALDQFVPTSQAEDADLAAMREFADEIWAVAEQAVEIEKARWIAAEQP